MLDIVFLGTGGSIPEAGRNHPAIAIRYEGWNLLFDCGEDVQRAFERARLGLNKNMACFVSHVHADHVLGLPGLLLRFSLLGRVKPLSIYGPKELIDFVKVAQSTINLGTTFETTVYGIDSGPVFSQDDITVTAFEVEHRGFALGYEICWQRRTGKFLPDKAEALGVPKGPLWNKLASGQSVSLDDGRVVEPGEVTMEPLAPIKIVYSGDTKPCESLRRASKGANILICEAMYTSEHADLAAERGHSTAKDAAQIAKDAGVGLLILTHYSPRYHDGSVIINEARRVFPNSILARDMMEVSLSLNGAYSVSQVSDYEFRNTDMDSWVIEPW
ncbi:MAG: ribonuclease Z [Candidatus Thorarchaeota archaeon]|nr:MAG: ribonuclease Z [Candidatus Thorarchaeota archaeon]RLI59110.1 MAG: ribonuclease Z [Candidatus Thorarchaeota archaeon]